MDDSSLVVAVDAATTDFKKNLFMIASILCGGLALFAGVLLLAVEGDARLGMTALLFFLPSVSSLVAVFSGRIDLAARFFTVGCALMTSVALFLGGETNANLAVAFFCLLMMLAAFTLTPRDPLGLAGISVATLIAYDQAHAVTSSAAAPDGLVPQLIVVLLFAVLCWMLSRHTLFLRQTLRSRVVGIEETTPELKDAARRLAAAAEQIHAMANQQREGAFRQSSAVKETREALRSTLDASAEISRSARAVFDNAEKTTKNGELAADRVAVLAEQAHRIAQILETIREISTKSELLALNASLESTKAGEAGRGFSLVARQMQQLAERVMGSVKDIKALTKEIRESTQGVQLSMEETIKLARATTDAGREISLVTQQQQSSTEQVTSAMDDISEITAQTASGSEQTLVSTEELRNVATELPALIAKLTSSHRDG